MHDTDEEEGKRWEGKEEEEWLKTTPALVYSQPFNLASGVVTVAMTVEEREKKRERERERERKREGGRGVEYDSNEGWK